MRRAGLVVLLLLVGGCVHLIEVHRTPYDESIFDVNKRMCLQRGGAWIYDKHPSPNGGWYCRNPVSGIDALQAALAEAKRFPYASGGAINSWKTPNELELAGTGDCKDLAIWTITRAWELAGDGLDFKLVVGKIKFRGGHAWVEYMAAGEIWWADPSVQRGKRLGRAGSF